MRVLTPQNGLILAGVVVSAGVSIQTTNIKSTPVAPIVVIKFGKNSSGGESTRYILG